MAFLGKELYEFIQLSFMYTWVGYMCASGPDILILKRVTSRSNTIYRAVKQPVVLIVPSQENVLFRSTALKHLLMVK